MIRFPHPIRKGQDLFRRGQSKMPTGSSEAFFKVGRTGSVLQILYTEDRAGPPYLKAKATDASVPITNFEIQNTKRI